MIISRARASSVAAVAAGGGDVKLYNISLTTAGRFNFYRDYSELTGVGTHTFYVQRTHGTVGQCSVDYAVTGDASDNASGTLTWADGETGIKSFTSVISTKADNGLHNVTATLSNPTNSAVLHDGTDTVAYGVIDDSSVPSDSDAVFYDSAAGGGGSGTAASPYNSIYTAITALNSSGKKYLCGKGTTIPDGTNTAFNADSNPQCINVPSTRANEAVRAYIMAWPGFTWAIDGAGGTNKLGFYAYSGESYLTFRNIDFTALVNTSASNGAGIFFHYGGSGRINIEYCTADNINGAAGYNNGAYMVWGVTSAKIWRCTSNNIQTNGDNTNTNTAGVFTYDGESVSVQRCEFTNSDSAVYHKRIATVGDVSTRFCFNHAQTAYGLHYGASGGSGVGHAYAIIQGNLFEGCTSGAVNHTPGDSPVSLGPKTLYVTNNVFDACGSGEIAAIHTRHERDSIFFNNIMYNCRKVWADYVDSSGLGGTEIEYADYNLESGTTLTSQRYEFRITNYSTAAAISSAHGFATNDNEANPVFTDATNDDYTLDTGSPGLTGGVDSTEQGIYLTGVEVLGS